MIYNISVLFRGRPSRVDYTQYACSVDVIFGLKSRERRTRTSGEHYYCLHPKPSGPRRRVSRYTTLYDNDRRNSVVVVVVVARTRAQDKTMTTCTAACEYT